MTRGAAVCHIRSPAVKAKTSASTGRTKESGQLPLRWAMGPQRAGEASLDTGLVSAPAPCGLLAHRRGNCPLSIERCPVPAALTAEALLWPGAGVVLTNSL